MLETIQQTHADSESHEKLIQEIGTLVPDVFKKDIYKAIIDKYHNAKSYTVILNFIVALHAKDESTYDYLQRHYSRVIGYTKIFEDCDQIIVTKARNAALLRNQKQIAQIEILTRDITEKCRDIFLCTTKEFNIVGATNLAKLPLTIQTIFRYIDNVLVFRGEMILIPMHTHLTIALDNRGYAQYAHALGIINNLSTTIQDYDESYIVARLWFNAVTQLRHNINDFWHLTAKAIHSNQQYWAMVKTLRFLLWLNQNFSLVVNQCANTCARHISPLAAFNSEFSEEIAQQVKIVLQTAEATTGANFKFGVRIIEYTKKALLNISQQVEHKETIATHGETANAEFAKLADQCMQSQLSIAMPLDITAPINTSCFAPAAASDSVLKIAVISPVSSSCAPATSSSAAMMSVTANSIAAIDSPASSNEQLSARSCSASLSPRSATLICSSAPSTTRKDDSAINSARSITGDSAAQTSAASANENEKTEVATSWVPT